MPEKRTIFSLYIWLVSHCPDFTWLDFTELATDFGATTVLVRGINSGAAAAFAAGAGGYAIAFSGGYVSAASSVAAASAAFSGLPPQPFSHSGIETRRTKYLKVRISVLRKVVV
jgi:hypothetical protein